MNDGSAFPPLRPPAGGSFLVQNIFTDFKRHDLGDALYERNYDGSIQKQFMTKALWGVGNEASFGHDGRSINLSEIILRHSGEAQASASKFAQLGEGAQATIEDFLRTLVLFPPDDTASNLDPGDPNAADFPQHGHGSIKLTVLFNNPNDAE
jgi:hypothetical protein